MTVTRVLIRPAQVHATTRERVQRAVASLGYVPDRAAGSLATRRSGFIGLVLPALANGNFAIMSEALTDALRPHGYELLIAFTGYSIGEEERQVRTLLARRPEAIVLAATTHAEGTCGLLAIAGVPVIEIADLPAAPIGQVVGFSNRDAGAAAARYLIGLGHRRIAGLGSRPSSGRIDTRGEARLEGFAQALRDAGIATDLIHATADIPVSFEQGAAAMAGLLDSATDVQAVFAISDLLAVGAMLECRRRDIAVPGRLSIVGFGDFEIGRQMVPSLTTVGVNFAALGLRAGELIARLLVSPETVRQHTDVGFALIERGSTAPPGRGA